MSTLPLPRVLGQRRANTLEVERENFERSQTVSISKAINNQETSVKEKHLRSAIIGTFNERGAGTFWNIATKLPLKGNPIVCWKFCHVLHKVLRDGHSHAIADSQKHRSNLQDIGKMWGLLKDGYGRLIQNYCGLLVAKLDFHRKNPRFPGNLSVTDEQLDDIGERDVNVFFQLSCEMFDYMEEILALQHAVFGSLDMSRSNSMTNAGQCRLAPLIPCIQDSSQLYDYTVKVLFKLHSALPPDTLSGHRERFLKQFKALRQFYISSSNLQYFKNLIQVPLLPENSPNFLVASDLSAHVSPVVILPPQTDTPENETADINLVDTSVPNSTTTTSHLDEIFSVDVGFQQRNGTVSPDQLPQKEKIIEQLMKENENLKMELPRIKIESERVIDDYKRHTAFLDLQLAEKERTIQRLSEVNESEKKITETLQNSELCSKLAETEKKAKSQEEKFCKMKEVYNKLREEHISLIRAKADVDKQLVQTKSVAEEACKIKNVIEEKLQTIQTEKDTIEEKMKQSGDISVQIETLTENNEKLKKKNLSLEEEVERLKSKILALEEKISEMEKENMLLQNKIDNMTMDSLKHEEEDLTKLYNILESVICEGERVIQTALDDFDSPSAAVITCTPECLIHQIETTKSSLEQLGTSIRILNNNPTDIEQILQGVCLFSHMMALTLLQGKGTSQSCSNIEKGDALACASKNLGYATLKMLTEMKTKASTDVPQTVISVASSLEKVAILAEALVPNMSTDQSQKLGDLIEEELESMDKAIEEAALRIEAMLNKSKAADSGIKLEVNGKILDACTELMKAVRELVKSSKDLQEEIVAQGKGSTSVKEFYSRNHRWTEGLISASKVAGHAAKFLVDAADKVVEGQIKFEELAVASQEIAAATAQLVVASKVKAERGSERLAKVSKASKVVTEATGNVVAIAKSCAQMVEESDVMDFSKLTLHQAKRLEMESQVRVLELESALVKERVKLAGLRKRHYHLAGASEGWEDE